MRWKWRSDSGNLAMSSIIPIKAANTPRWHLAAAVVKQPCEAATGSPRFIVAIGQICKDAAA